MHIAIQKLKYRIASNKYWIPVQLYIRSSPLPDPLTFVHVVHADDKLGLLSSSYIQEYIIFKKGVGIDIKSKETRKRFRHKRTLKPNSVMR